MNCNRLCQPSSAQRNFQRPGRINALIWALALALYHFENVDTFGVSRAAAEVNVLHEPMLAESIVVSKLPIDVYGLRAVLQRCPSLLVDWAIQFSPENPRLGCSQNAPGHLREIDFPASYFAVGLPGFRQIPDQEDGPGKREEGRNPSEPDLFFGGVRSPYLGVQIFSLMLVGFGFAFLSVFGIRRALDDLDLKRRRWGWLWFSVGAVGGLFCYGWAWGGHPLRVWGIG